MHGETIDVMIEPAISLAPQKNVTLPLDVGGVTKPNHTSHDAELTSEPDTVVCEPELGMRREIATYSLHLRRDEG
jgi:hypothetical protein